MNLTPEGFPSLSSAFLDKEFSQKAPCINHWNQAFLFPLPGDVQVYLDGVREGIFPIPTKKEIAQGSNDIAHSHCQWKNQKVDRWAYDHGYFIRLLPPCIFEALFQKVYLSWKEILGPTAWIGRNQFPRVTAWMEKQLAGFPIDPDQKWVEWKQIRADIQLVVANRFAMDGNLQGYCGQLERIVILHMLKKWQYSSYDYDDMDFWQKLLAHQDASSYKMDLQRAFIWCWKVGWLKEQVEWRILK